MSAVAIIGAGLSGLILAKKLGEKHNVQLFEKSAKAGGRLASVDILDCSFDFGAQYFTIKDEDFAKFIHPYCESGVVSHWHARFAELNIDRVKDHRPWDKNNTHYVGVPNNNSFALSLAEGLDINYQVKANQVIHDKGRWCLLDKENNKLGDFDWVVFAMPADQIISILPDSCEFYKSINAIKMTPCFTLMLELEQDFQSSWDVGFIDSEILSWVSKNFTKPCRDKAKKTLIVNSTNSWAAENQLLSDDNIKELMISELRKIIGQDSLLLKNVYLHRWRFANAFKRYENKFLLDKKNKLAACGDWCIQGRVESAFLSAESLSQALLKFD